jgi:4-amino-4-deoxychorismate lyase
MFWYNGQLIHSQTLELDINNPGLLYGATVFTTLRVYHNSLDSRLTSWEAHCDRLTFSLETFGWRQPNWQNVRHGSQILLEYFPVLRITLFPDGREWIIGRLLPPNLTEKQTNGISCALANPEFYRSLPVHKTGNYLSAWLAKNNAQYLDAQEAILVDGAGNWLETTTGNLWGWQNSMWWTPPLESGILPGIMRSQLFDWLESEQQEVKQEPWTQELVQNFQAIGYSNSVVEIIPIHTVQQSKGRLEYNPHHSSFKQLSGLFLT